MDDRANQPPVLIVGGFMTAPVNYWPLRRRLRKRGAGRVDIAPLWPPDWALAGLLGLGPVMRRTARAIVRTYRAAGNQPIIVVGHSGGGIAPRLAMSRTPFHGRRGGVAEAVGCLVTLGTPHSLAELANRYRHAGHEASAFLDRESPGAFFAPRTAYLTVGSSYSAPPFPGVVGRLANDIFSMVVGDDTPHIGDGIVPAGAVHLPGAVQLTYDDVRHGHIGRSWYGANEIVDRWWPVAVDLWREALAARRDKAAGSGSAGEDRAAGEGGPSVDRSFETTAEAEQGSLRRSS
ncbi:MAG: hypothetical protein M3N29_03495 [Chloroflexota bacterium]|nr:hypothetical protein [Chloroflexota bacterium]